MAGSYRAGRLNCLPACPPAAHIFLELSKTTSHIMETAACASDHTKTFSAFCLLPPVISYKKSSVNVQMWQTRTYFHALF
jgi:hypothetical protein